MSELLELARASYRLRDDDNIHLGRVESQLAAAVAEGSRRLAGRFGADVVELAPEVVAHALRDPDFRPVQSGAAAARAVEPMVRARQLVGQPASPGVAIGTARVLRAPSDTPAVRPGEVLVCDAIDPNMTFVVPLAAGIVERRGGMLIHGAIIAREYGIPCVTGVPGAVDMILTGDRVTVDGHLGIVTLTERAG
jgi:pyruvate,water dikinase